MSAALGRCWRCGSPWARRRCPDCGARQPMPDGQALVEFALIAPVALFTALGFLEAGFLVGAKAEQDRATAVVARWAAEHPGADWRPVAAAELAGCAVSVAPGEARDLVVASSTCRYQPRVTRGLWEGLPISSAEAAAAAPAPTASPSPSPEPSPTPAASS